MFEFLRRLFAPEPRSSETARERLRLVLLSDHLSLAPEVVEALKRDLLAVISQYLEIDPAHADVTFEQGEREVAMLASIPITGVRDRLVPPPRPVPAPAVPARELEPEAQVVPRPQAEPAEAQAEGEVLEDAELEPQVAHGEAPVETFHSHANEAVLETAPTLSRRQRRRQQRPSADFGPA